MRLRSLQQAFLVSIPRTNLSNELYSQVPNRRAPTLINFSKIFQPKGTLLGLPRLLIFENIFSGEKENYFAPSSLIYPLFTLFWWVFRSKISNSHVY